MHPGPPKHGQPAEPPGDPLIGCFAGGYRIEAVLGAGGMGRVYRARHVELGGGAAIKVLARHLTGDADLMRRFKVEAQAASRLRHPNIVGVTDFGILTDGRPYYVMELLAGEILAAYFDREGPVSVPTLVAILGPVLAGLGRRARRRHRAPRSQARKRVPVPRGWRRGAQAPRLRRGQAGRSR